MFEIGDNSTALYNVAVVMDPLSETAQKWSSLLQVGFASDSTAVADVAFLVAVKCS